MFGKIKRYAFSMAEVMIVFAITTVVVAVSVKIIKAQYESANRYLYYSAYKTLRDLTNEIHLEVNTVNADGTKLEEVDDEGNVIENYSLKPLPNSDADNLCTRIAAVANLAIGGNRCSAGEGSGSSQADIENAVAQPEKDLSLMMPDLTLRNGMKLYNVKKAKDHSLLSNFVIYNMDGTQDNTRTPQARSAYLVYVDIDGSRNSTILWEDVFPFYITLNGYVIPAYPETAGQEGGANNIVDMAASVQYEDEDAAGKVAEKWLVKSVTFQQAACRAGFVNGSYCAAFTVDDTCKKSSTNFADCKVKVVVPLKF
ncbi:hypothetical protein J6E39_05940 [bacterium]|nr:hypothetical protein [bacterium]